MVNSLFIFNQDIVASLLDNLSLIEEAHEAGFIVDVWTPNDPEEVLTMVDAGLDFVTTDRPDIMAAILEGIQ